MGIVQIVMGEEYLEEVERTSDVIVQKPVPRGKMYDRHNRIIVDNLPKNAITYTYEGASQKEMLEVAEKLAELIEKKPDKVREREKKDYWIILNPDLAKAKITEEEWDSFYAEKLTNKEIYNLQLKRIKGKDLESLTEKDLEILAIFKEFNSGYALTPQIVKNQKVTPKEFAAVSENLQRLPGVDTTTDWDRSYPFGQTLKTILGKVTDADEGIPKERLDYYLARDYSLNDRVGKSYIEQEYEEILHGQKAKVKNVTDKAGNVLQTIPLTDGQRGNDLVLTFDMDLQVAVEKILEEELIKVKKLPGTGLLDRAFVVAMNPYTGEVLTMAGKQLAADKDSGGWKTKDFASGNITTSYNFGSAVKGATVLTGYKTGAIHPGKQYFDSPIVIKNTPPKASWRNMGTINDLEALRYSSNVYMFRTAIEIAKGRYVPNGPLPIDTMAFNTIRDSFNQFGLGTRTGIDLPNEQIGFKGPGVLPGFLLDLVIGQYDTYTPMQMAQYASTIANGGYRVKPQIVKEIREAGIKNDELGPIIKEIQPEILNKIDAEEGWIERVQEGFRQVMQYPRGTAYSVFNTAPYLPAGKTGTAEAFYDGPERYKYDDPPGVLNLSLVAYAPHDQPEIAISVIVPWAYQGDVVQSVNLTIGRRVLDTYFELKNNRTINHTTTSKVVNYQQAIEAQANAENSEE